VPAADDALKKSTNIESLISSGNGTRATPFVLVPRKDIDAALAQLEVLREFGRSRQVFWRVMSSERVGAWVEALSAEVVEFSVEEVTTTQWKFYFDLSAAEGSPYSMHPPLVWTGPEKFALPYELGWMHFDGVKNNSSDSSVIDLSFAYGSPAAKATVYFYKRSPSTKTKQAELFDALSAISGDDVSDPWPQASIGPLLMKILITGENLTIVAIAELGPYFVKLRLTHFDDEKVREMMGRVIHDLSKIIQSAKGEVQ